MCIRRVGLRLWLRLRARLIRKPGDLGRIEEDSNPSISSGHPFIKINQTNVLGGCGKISLQESLFAKIIRINQYPSQLFLNKGRV